MVSGIIDLLSNIKPDSESLTRGSTSMKSGDAALSELRVALALW
jgi:hypothetical protein